MAIRAKKNFPNASLASLLQALYAGLSLNKSAFKDRLCILTISRLLPTIHCRFQRPMNRYVAWPIKTQNIARQKVPKRNPAMGNRKHPVKKDEKRVYVVDHGVVRVVMVSNIM